MHAFPRAVTRCLTLGCALVGAAALLTGCAAGGAGSDLTAQPAYDALATPDARIRLPDDRHFNIGSVSVKKNAAAGGTAVADATIGEAGTAELVTRVAGGGDGDAVLQLGHAVRNETRQQLDIEFRVSFEYECMASDDDPARLPEASVGVRLYARDGRNHLVRDVALLSHNTETGPLQGAAQVRQTVTLTAAPGESVSVYLGANAGVMTKPPHAAEARLKIIQPRIEIAARSAAAPATAPATPR